MNGDELQSPKSVQITPKERVEEGFVVFPYNERQFRDFIKSLLGSPQTISNSFYGAFEIEVGDINNLYQLILQRITQQNEGSLIQFKSKVVYSDNSSVELNSIEELLTYNEIRPVVSRSVHLTWDFIVRFRDKETSEKQRIQLSLVSSGRALPAIDAVLQEEFRRTGTISGFINFRIEHTARTWGADIEALLTNHIKSLLKKPTTIKKFISDHSGKIGMGTGVLFFLVVLGGCIISLQEFTQNQLIKLHHILPKSENVDLYVVKTTINELANMIAGGQWPQFVFALVAFMLVALIGAFFFAIWIVENAERDEPSFILLTKESFKNRTATLGKLKRKWISFIFALILSITTGVLSNVIFGMLFNQ